MPADHLSPEGCWAWVMDRDQVLVWGPGASEGPCVDDCSSFGFLVSADPCGLGHQLGSHSNPRALLVLKPCRSGWCEWPPRGIVTFWSGLLPRNISESIVLPQSQSVLMFLARFFCQGPCDCFRSGQQSMIMLIVLHCDQDELGGQ